MKKISKIILILSIIILFSCDRDELGNVDMGTYYGPYIHFASSGTQTVTAGGSPISVQTSIYVPQWENFEVQYELRGSYNVSGSFTVEKGNRSDTLMLSVPINSGISGDVVDTLYLVSATNGVKIGRQNVPAYNIIKKPIKIIGAGSGS